MDTFITLHRLKYSCVLEINLCACQTQTDLLQFSQISLSQSHANVTTGKSGAGANFYNIYRYGSS